MYMDQTGHQIQLKDSNINNGIIEKDKLIELLEQKNYFLFKEVERIEKMMKEYDLGSSQKSNQNDINFSILQTTNDPDILAKELKNCNKRIKHYEYEVEKLKHKTLSAEISDKRMSIDLQFKEKSQIQNKLKQELNLLSKEIADNSKKLAGNNHQLQMEKEFKSKSDELKFFKEMIKDYEEKESIKYKNMKMEHAHIKNLEKQFISQGGSVSDLQAVKQNALSQFQEGRLIKRESKALNEDLKASVINLQQSTLCPQQETEKNRTKANYERMLNELNLLEKLNKKYEKQFQESNNILKDIEEKTQLKTLKLYKLEKEIQDINASISLKKTCIVAENMKPTHRKLSQRSVSSVRQDVPNLGNKRKRNIINMTAIMTDRQQRLYHN